MLTPPALLYFLVRDLSADQAAAAFANAADIIDLERSLGLDWEATLQQRIINIDWVLTLVNWIYIYGHFPLIVAAMFILFRQSRRNFHLMRNAIIVSGAVGLVCFALYPVAPPRLFDPGVFFDSLTELSRSYKVLQNPNLTNQFAAVPSFHVGWNAIVAFAIWRASALGFMRIFAVLSPVAMVSAVVLTANHWILDIVAGLGVAAIGIGTALLVDRIIDRFNLRVSTHELSPPAAVGDVVPQIAESTPARTG